MRYHVLKVIGLGLDKPHFEIWCADTEETWAGSMDELDELGQSIARAAEQQRRPDEWGIPRRVLDIETEAEDPKGKRILLDIE